VDYELYHDSNPTGNIVSGTGSAISFGIISPEGIYTAMGFTDFCSEEMVGMIHVYVRSLPAQPSTPEGADVVCNLFQTIYSVDTLPNSDNLVWTLDPSEAGEVMPSGFEATVTWNTSFTGMAELSCHGENPCGEGEESDSLLIEVYGTPEPDISGPPIVCSGYEEDYQTPYFSGSEYTWEVMGGDVVAGSGTHLVTVHWGDPGNGSLIVEELNPGGCSASSQTFEVIIEECTFLGEKKSGNMIIYPNPAENLVHILLPETQLSADVSVSIVNSMGERILIEELNSCEEKLIIDVSGMAPGLYLVQVADGESTTVKGKIIVK
jgi:hypothetical protein